MMEWSEILEGIEKDSAIYVAVACLFGLIFFSRHITDFIVSSFEGILSKKEDETKRNVLMSIILFFIFGVLNFVAAYEKNTIIGLLLFGIGIFIGCKAGLYDAKKDVGQGGIIAYLLFVISMSLSFSSIIHAVVEVSIWSIVCVISLVETCLAMLRLSDGTGKKTSITVNVNDAEWYVYKRVDEKYLLCGDNEDINAAKKTILIDMDDIVKKNVEFTLINDISKEIKPSKKSKRKKQSKRDWVQCAIRINWCVLALILVGSTVQSIVKKCDYVSFTMFAISLILAIEDCYWNFFKNKCKIGKVLSIFFIALYEIVIIVQTVYPAIMDFGGKCADNVVIVLSMLVLLGVLIIRKSTVKLE